jgi:hydroxymethylpyrimidine kinase/phosphomethylpyrimidine kinase/thiamine-phosphate diphosphorylase
MTSSSPPIAWSIAGSDPSGGAGVQADLRTFHALGAHGCTVVTTLTAQNTIGVERLLPVAVDMVEAQMQTLAKDLPPRVVKVGMLTTAGQVRAVAKFLAGTEAPAVCDPILASGTGRPVMDPPTQEAWINRLLPAAALVTPNRREAATLAALPRVAEDNLTEAARRILERGPASVLIKGGHGEGERSLDFWRDADHALWLDSPRREMGRVHGAGCVLSSAIAARLAARNDLGDALTVAKAFVNQGLRHARGMGRGAPALTLLGFPDQPEDLPRVATRREDLDRALDFPPLPALQPAVYPIADSAARVDTLLAAGASIVQLRIKRAFDLEVDAEVRAAVEAGRRHDRLVIINDHWEAALRHGARGLHLGQDDLDRVDLPAVANAGLLLGISTHSGYELARALTLNPSYVAIGAVYPTTSKAIPPTPLGLDGFARLARLSRAPVVAIGGLTPERGRLARAAGARLCAVISDLAHAAPAARLEEWGRAG